MVWLSGGADSDGVAFTPMGTRVWLRNPDASADEVYILGNVVEEPAIEHEPGDVVVKFAGSKKEHALHASDAFTANPEGFTCPDNTMLIHLSEATLLANLRSRYQEKDIYTLTGTILLVRARMRMSRICEYAAPHEPKFPPLNC